MAPKVPRSEIGTATAGTAVARPLRRNRNTTRITSAIAIRSVVSTARSEARMVTVRSIATRMSMSAGIEALSEVLDSVENVRNRRLTVREPEVAYVLDRVEHL